MSSIFIQPFYLKSRTDFIIRPVAVIYFLLQTGEIENVVVGAV